METTVNERIKILREFLDLTQDDFARRIDLTSTQLSRIETGKSNPQSSTLNNIVDAFKVSRKWLTEGQGELQAQVMQAPAQYVNELYQDATYRSLQDQVTMLKEELKKAWAVAAHFSDGKLNFLKPSKNKGSARLIHTSQAETLKAYAA